MHNLLKPRWRYLAAFGIILFFVVYYLNITKLTSAQILKDGSIVSVSSNQPVLNGRGNTMGNSLEAGFASQQGEWIYYSNPADNNKLYKIRTDGTEKTKINDDYSLEINVQGDWIFYTSTDYRLLTKIKVDGSEKVILNRNRSSNINVLGDWIYFTEETKELPHYDYIYKIKLDGSKKTLIKNEDCLSMTIYQDWLYYADKSGYLYKMKPNGSQKTKLSTEKCQQFTIAGNNIYYTDSAYKLFQTDLDGKRRKLLNTDQTISPIVVGNTLYYANDSHGSYLYKIKTDGSGKQLVCKEPTMTINAVGDWLFCNSNVYGNQEIIHWEYYKISLDKTLKQEIN